MRYDIHWNISSKIAADQGLHGIWLCQYMLAEIGKAGCDSGYIRRGVDLIDIPFLLNQE